eukprot:CAMPEP_0204878036 /NCGR_PEP_ID=MMETSP1348-20121228/48525_1 /ASSEMBLY_ACC=CAM_ASM_000700 /TAXON_ID=215587 /ORGANISM="Aplanochytrium stocchinoi, Strain GSBS06" /LENGTH=406 /DNA_ID=CAMNT_0052034971 /DNA_START=512 /DNA_END=1729 /DNA_ORIENTATION=-
MTPEDLNNILKVQGISDWSVERVIEQSLVKGNVVILHLEENPEPHAVQSKMFELVQKMVRGLLSKYQDLGAKVIYVITSNYVPCKVIHDSFNIIELFAPTHEEQRTWAKDMLQQKVQDYMSTKFELNIGAEVYPPYTSDMRPLNNWWLCLGFFASKVLVSSSHQKQRSEDHSNKLCVRIEKIQQQRQKANAENEYLVTCFRNGNAPLEEYTLTSPDSFFFQDKLHSKLDTILHMCFREYVTPAVIIVSNKKEKEKKDAAVVKISTNVKEWAEENEVHLRTTHVTLLSEEDKHLVTGNPSEIRGGLLSYIDDSNNKNSTAKIFDCHHHHCSSGSTHCNQLDKRLIVVYANVSPIGQFMLRELIEQSQYSRSHRLRVSKSRLCFIINPVDNTQLSPQLLSEHTAFYDG